MSAAPSAFVDTWISTLATRTLVPRKALDVAMGRGRHALILARHGFITFGVDIRFDAVREARRAAAAEGLELHGWCADLTHAPLPHSAFDLVIVTRYLQRDLFPSLKASVRPEGYVIYETFTTLQRERRFGPTSPTHLLRPHELRDAFSDWDIRFYEEVERPEALARLVAQRRRRS